MSKDIYIGWSDIVDGRGREYYYGYSDFIKDYIPQDKEEKIINFDPHYTNDKFKNMQLVFGTKCKTDCDAYIDRLREWDRKQSDLAQDKANEGCTPGTALWVEKWLSTYYNRLVDIKYIMAGYNWATGYPYQYFAWDWKEN